MKELFIRLFYKHKAVIVKMADESGRLTTHWAIPRNDNTVRLIGVDKAIILSKNSMLLSTKHNIPTFIVRYNNCEPVNLADLKNGQYGVNEFDLILGNDMADKVFKASHQSKLSDEGKIIILVIIIGILALGYFLNTKLEDIKSIIEPVPIIEVILEEDVN